jgi:hypothetical protein
MGTPRASGNVLWPWSTSAAVLLTPVILVALVVGHGVARANLDWPDPRYGGWVLLGIVLLSILPVLLVLVELVATAGGSVKVAGVAVSFAATSQELADRVPSATLTENLQTSDDAPVSQSSLRSILRALRSARDSEVTIVDLRSGQTWWESRLFILVSGAARTGRPRAIAFVGDRNGQKGVFLGWAPPAQLLQAHLAHMPELADAFATSRATAELWRLDDGTNAVPGVPAAALGVPAVARGATAVKLPWRGQLRLPEVDRDKPDPAFAEELFLQRLLDDDPRPELRQHVTIQRLLQLYETVLITDHVDVDANDEAWVELLGRSQRRFFAMTKAGVFKGLVPRDALISALVTRLTVTSAGR